MIESDVDDPEPLEPLIQRFHDGTWMWWDRDASHCLGEGKKGRWVPETTAEHRRHRIARQRDALKVKLDIARGKIAS